MRKPLLLAGLMLLCATAPAYAAGPTKTKFTGADLIDVRFSGTPYCGTVYALVNEDDGTGSAFVFWRQCDGGDTISGQEYALAPGDLVINATLKRATLRLPGTLLNWSAKGDGRRYNSDVTEQVGDVTTRSRIQGSVNYATSLTATLDNHAHRLARGHLLRWGVI